jgi:putative addiction module killer protein
VVKLTVREFVTSEGRSPFREWLRTLDVAAQARIQARVLRFELGNFGDHKAVGGGVLEARVMFGPGYRIYFAREADRVVLLLLGGDKRTQPKDIRRAQEPWLNYRETSHGKAK